MTIQLCNFHSATDREGANPSLIVNMISFFFFWTVSRSMGGGKRTLREAAGKPDGTSLGGYFEPISCQLLTPFLDMNNVFSVLLSNENGIGTTGGMPPRKHLFHESEGESPCLCGKLWYLISSPHPCKWRRYDFLCNCNPRWKVQPASLHVSCHYLVLRGAGSAAPVLDRQRRKGTWEAEISCHVYFDAQRSIWMVIKE